MRNSDQSGYTGRTEEPHGHYHDGSWYTDDECHCALNATPEDVHNAVMALWAGPGFNARNDESTS